MSFPILVCHIRKFSISIPSFIMHYTYSLLSRFIASVQRIEQIVSYTTENDQSGSALQATTASDQICALKQHISCRIIQKQCGCSYIFLFPSLFTLRSFTHVGQHEMSFYNLLCVLWEMNKEVERKNTYHSSVCSYSYNCTLSLSLRPLSH